MRKEFALGLCVLVESLALIPYRKVLLTSRCTPYGVLPGNSHDFLVWWELRVQIFGRSENLPLFRVDALAYCAPYKLQVSLRPRIELAKTETPVFSQTLAPTRGIEMVAVQISYIPLPPV